MRQLRTGVSCCIISLLTTFSATWVQVQCLSNGLAVTPPMGWNTWNAFHDEIDEELVQTAADILVVSGLQTSGYEYLIIDGKICDVLPLLLIATRVFRPDLEPAPTWFRNLAPWSECVCATDGWATRTRYGSGPIQANSTRFPHGIKAAADYVHAKGALHLERFLGPRLVLTLGGH